MSMLPRSGAYSPEMMSLKRSKTLPLNLASCICEIGWKLFALVEFVDLCLLGRLRPLVLELVGRRPAGGMSQKNCGEQKTCSNGPEQFHRRTSFAC